MNRLWAKKVLTPSAVSLLVIGVFVFIGTGSLELQFESVEYKGGGIYEARNDFSDTKTTSYTGPIDKKDRWHGDVTIVHYDSEPSKYSPDAVGLIRTTEKVKMVHGKREGESTKTYDFDDETSATVVECCYVNGVFKLNSAGAKSTSMEVSSFQILQDAYPWYFTQLLAFNFDSSYVESYLAELDAILNIHDYGDTVFFDFYDEALDSLGETPYDSIIELQAILTFQLGIEEMKSNEYRQAVVDRFWAGTGSSYKIVEARYRPYLQYLNEVDVSDLDFEQFCIVLDSTMDSYPPLDTQDPFFIDSIDSYLYSAISEIVETEEDTSIDNSSVKKRSFLLEEPRRVPGAIKHISSFDWYSVADNRVAEVAEIVALSMYTNLMEGDIIGKVAEQAWMKNQSLPILPTVATELAENASATSVNLRGYIIDEGGADIIANGIVWATYYNPSLDDNVIPAAKGSEEFTLTLEGLTEGNTYYARAYASNSAGTAYGNSLEFIAESTIGINSRETNQTLGIYPNPSSGVTTFRVYSTSEGASFLTLSDLKGSIVYEYALDVFPGDNMVQVDLSYLQSGIYLVQLRSDSDIRASKRLIILK